MGVNVISVYAPQTGWTKMENTVFWELLGHIMGNIPESAAVWIAANLNGHIGKEREATLRIGSYGLD